MMKPEKITTTEQLEKALCRPYPQLVEMMKRLDGNIMILGAGGKIGPSLTRTAVNACREADVDKIIFAVDKYFSPQVKADFEADGVKAIVCDLSEYDQVAELPRAKNVVFMAGRKFGDVGSEPLTWLMNTVVTGNVGQAFRESRITAFSTGCVYDLMSNDSDGSVESDLPRPVGEYANSCLGRERIFEYFAENYGTNVLLFRLNYAVDLRYGVLVEIARAVFEERTVDINVNAVNFIWQGDVNNRALLSLELADSPAMPLNVTGTKKLTTVELAKRFGELFDKEVNFTGTDSGKGYLSNASRSIELFGEPMVTEEDLVQMVADWILHGGEKLDKPTHFSITNGQFLDEKE